MATQVKNSAGLAGQTVPVIELYAVILFADLPVCVSGNDVKNVCMLQESKKTGRRVLTETVVRRIIIHRCYVCNNKSFPKSAVKSTLLPVMAEIGLTRFMCY